RRREAPASTIVRTQIVERGGPATLPEPAPAPAPPASAPVTSLPTPLLPPAPASSPARPPSVTLLASPTYATVDGEITVTLTVLSGTPGAREWIGLFAVGAEVTKYVSYQYVSEAR